MKSVIFGCGGVVKWSDLMLQKTLLCEVLIAVVVVLAVLGLLSAEATHDIRRAGCLLLVACDRDFLALDLGLESVLLETVCLIEHCLIGLVVEDEMTFELGALLNLFAPYDRFLLEEAQISVDNRSFFVLL